MFDKYDINVEFTEPIIGTVPMSKDLMANWLKSATPIPVEEQERIMKQLSENFEKALADAKKERLVGFERDHHGWISLCERHWKGWLEDSAKLVSALPSTKRGLREIGLGTRIKGIGFCQRTIPLFRHDKPVGMKADIIEEQTIIGMSKNQASIRNVEKLLPPITCKFQIRFPQGLLKKEQLDSLLEIGETFGLGNGRKYGNGRFVAKAVSWKN